MHSVETRQVRLIAQARDHARHAQTASNRAKARFTHNQTVGVNGNKRGKVAPRVSPPNHGLCHPTMDSATQPWTLFPTMDSATQPWTLPPNHGLCHHPPAFDRNLHSRMAFEPTMLCDVINTIAEFIVRVLHPRMPFDRMPALLKLLLTCVWSTGMPLGWFTSCLHACGPLACLLGG
jgi:hypothetical protein